MLCRILIICSFLLSLQCSYLPISKPSEITHNHDPDVKAFWQFVSDTLILSKSHAFSCISDNKAYSKALSECMSILSEKIKTKVLSTQEHFVREERSLENDDEFYDIFQNVVKSTSNNVLRNQREIKVLYRPGYQGKWGPFDLFGGTPEYHCYLLLGVPQSAAASSMIKELNYLQAQNDSLRRVNDDIALQRKDSIFQRLYKLKVMKELKQDSTRWHAQKDNWLQNQTDLNERLHLIEVRLQNLENNFSRSVPFADHILYDKSETDFRDYKYFELNLNILKDVVNSLHGRITNGTKLLVVGYSDITMPENETHQSFGLKRAENIKQYLLNQNIGLHPQQIQTEGRGPRAAKYPSDTDLHNRYNRKVCIFILKW